LGLNSPIVPPKLPLMDGTTPQVPDVPISITNCVEDQLTLTVTERLKREKL
jgi:hypothetical protein